MLKNSYFQLGFRKMIPITTGVIPFGAVMGSVCADAQMSFFQTLIMNLFVYSGAAQLASVELMTKQTLIPVVVATGLVINLRFLLYSAGLSPALHDSSPWTKLLASHTLTDQSFAVVSSYQHQLKTSQDTVTFYFGTAACMFLVWQSSVVAGYVFGNFAPASWSLDYAIPISFLALLIPTLKSNKYLLVAAASSVLSVGLYWLPYKLSLIATALLSITLAYFLTRKKQSHD